MDCGVRPQWQAAFPADQDDLPVRQAAGIPFRHPVSAAMQARCRNLMSGGSSGTAVKKPAVARLVPCRGQISRGSRYKRSYFK